VTGPLSQEDRDRIDDGLIDLDDDTAEMQAMADEELSAT
jgi:hypothetical protein